MTERVKVLEKVLDANDRIAAENRAHFRARKVLVVNLMGGPGAGKTSILERLLPVLRPDGGLGVVEGDISTTADAERIAALDVPVVQINTDRFGGTCHLEAHAVRDAAAQIDADRLAYLVVENVGNLVCPAEFDLGEEARIGVLSVTEGEDKPVKYPILFRVVDLVLVTKIDLLPHLRVDEARIHANLRKVNPGATIIRFSAETGEGVQELADWMRARRAALGG